MDLFKSLILVQTLIIVFAQDIITKTVITNYGPVRGVQNYTLQNRRYFSFRGIPFGKAPVGDLRFKPPQPVEPWKPSTLDAFDYGPSCYISVIDLAFNPKISQSEDCLFLNVFVPANVSSEKLNVMVFLVGGGWLSSRNTDLGPDFLLEKNVILVTLNYRVGAFGFMSLGTCEYSGNMGLKDQQLALKWVHENIEYFGGDKKKVTLFGQSAGAGSTHHHMLNAESRKYFRRAICMSGTVFSPMAFTRKTDLQRMYKVANQLNQTIDEFDDLIDFLKEVPPKDLIAVTSGIDEETGELIWKPKLEKCRKNRPFLVQSPQQYYKNHYADVDVMFGVTSGETLGFLKPFVKAPELLGTHFKDFNISVQFPGIAFPIYSKQSRVLQSEIRKFYIGDDPIGAHSLLPFANLLTQMHFEYGSTKSAIIQSMRSYKRTYYFRYSFTGVLDLFRLVTNITSLPYATHSDEEGYIFRITALDALYKYVLATKDTDPLSAQALQNIINMTTLYTSFAKTGVPIINGDSTEQFLPVGLKYINFLDITNDGMLRKLYPHLDEYYFWRRLERIAKQMQGKERRHIC